MERCRTDLLSRVLLPHLKELFLPYKRTLFRSFCLQSLSSHSLWSTKSPRSARSSSTSRYDSEKRKYQPTANRIISGSNWRHLNRPATEGARTISTQLIKALLQSCNTSILSAMRAGKGPSIPERVVRQSRLGCMAVTFSSLRVRVPVYPRTGPRCCRFIHGREPRRKDTRCAHSQRS